jgi:hypothetical protein
LLHIPHEPDTFDGLRSKALAGIPENCFDSVSDILFQFITHESRLAGLVQQGPRKAELWVVFRS